jgi:hypothetical protein
MDNLVYEDNPWPSRSSPYWTRFRPYWTRAFAWSMQITPVILIIFFSGFLLSHSQFHDEAVSFNIIIATAFLILITYYALLPTKYQIFNEKIRIVMGWVLHFDIPFSNIENVTAATFQDLWGLNINFINSYSSNYIMRIIRKHGAKVHITPWDRPLFLENLNKAIYDWKCSTTK